MAEISTLVPAQTQAAASAPDTFTLNSFISGLAALATPVAQIVTANAAAKNTATTTTGDGLKTAAPSLTTNPAGNSLGISTNALIIGGVAVVGLVALILVLKK